MQSLELQKTYTPEEYFRMEEAGEQRHEFINGNLIEISGASRKHHKICKNLLRILENLLGEKGYEVFIENMKVKIENENQYYYPDIFISREIQTDDNKYVQFEPELIVEVLNESTRAKDMADKFIQYRKIKTLQYYLLVEPEKYLVFCNFKNDEGEWDMVSYTKEEEIIALPKLDISVSMKDIYKK